VISPLSKSAGRLERDRRPRLIALFALGVLIMLLLPMAISASGLRVNLTDSMPRGIYRIGPHPLTLRSGDVVATCIPLAIAQAGRRRRYLGSGRCPGGVEPLLKIVAATAGDTVMVDSRGVTINNRALPDSKYLTSDRAGRPLDHWTNDRYLMHSGETWLYSPFRYSWDSRYWGPVPTSDILGTAAPLFIFETRETDAT